MKKEILNDNIDITANSQQIQLLKKNFPQCFDKDGNFITHKMEEIVGKSGLEVSKESYSLNWLGKSYARLLANENPRTLLKENKEYNTKEKNKESENLLIKGDNLEVLKHLSNAYAEQIKMIYIDPPYNTGSDGFVYNDDRKFKPEELSRLAGIDLDESKRILEFTQSNANSHSAWLTFMYPRLYIARSLLKEDGVIFISIDDNEEAQLKLLCDEIFGEENFVAQIPWKKRTAKSDVPFGVSQDYEWILMYAKVNFYGGLAFERKYHKSDDYDERWRLSDLTTQKIEADRPNSAFDLVDPKTNKVYKYNPNRLWGITKDTFQEYYDRGKIVFPDDYDFLNITIPAYRVFESEDRAKALKKYGSERSIKASSTFLPKEVGMTQDGNKDLKNIFKNILFSNPKPVSLIKHFIKIINDSNALVLDFFAGSGTTAHAVMQLNVEDDGNRQFITVQISEETDKKSEANKAGYKTIFDITKARIEKAAAKIAKENPDYKGDLGFKIFETIPVWDGYPDDIKEVKADTVLFDGSKLSNEELEVLLTTWKVHDGMELSHELSEIDLAGYEGYLGEETLYFVHTGFTTEALKNLIEKLDSDKTFEPSRIVLFGYNFASKHQRELGEALSSYANKKSIELDLIVRY